MVNVIYKTLHKVSAPTSNVNHGIHCHRLGFYLRPDGLLPVERLARLTYNPRRCQCAASIPARVHSKVVNKKRVCHRGILYAECLYAHPLHTAPSTAGPNSGCYWPCRNPCHFDVELATIILSLF
jgi:hypothetical protein